jgi:signal transduction histidine kinase
MTRDPFAPRRRLRLRLRLSLWLAALVVLTTAAVAAVALVLVESTFQRELDQRLERLANDTREALRQQGLGVAERVELIERALRGPERDLLVTLLRDPDAPRVYDAASRLKGDLDRLDVLDDEGTILTSGHWPERVGRPDPASLELVPGRVEARRVVDATGVRLALAVRRVVEVGTLEVHLVGGRVVDTAFLDGIARGDAAWVTVEDEELAVSTTAGSIDRAAVAGGGGSWQAARFLLDPDEPVVHVAVDRGPLRSLVGRLRLSFAVMGAIGALLATLAGLWIAGTITRPVARLIRSVDAIARGEADYTFPAQADHELDELVESFSRLHRSLAEQQTRALAAERVAAWREAARRVAHEIKNPLVPIRLTVENLARARDRAPEQFDTLFDEGARTILEEVQQLQRLVGEFSEFARLPEPRPEPVPLEPLIGSVLSLLGTDDDVRIVRTGDALPEGHVDADQISRALKNVVQNAIEASTSTAPATVRVETAVEGDGIEIAVSDEGPGFDAETIRRVFEPYFTTKSGGTGLGMAIAQRILTEHGGAIDVANRRDGGATVTLRFPRRFERWETQDAGASAALGGSA